MTEITCVVLIDGTGDDDRKKNVSNVVNLRNGLIADEQQIVIYEDGIGNKEEWKNDFTRIFSEVTGEGAHWVMDRAFEKLLQALQAAKEAKSLKDGDKLKISVGGFSRGAALARHFANKYINAHLMQSLKQALKLDLSFIIEAEYLFDTVPAFGIPIYLFGGFPLEENKEWDFSIPKDTLAFHAVSIDERRRAFTPCLVDKVENKTLEVYFAGDHSTIGGGHTPPSQGTIMGEKDSLRFMAKHAYKNGLRFSKHFLEENNVLNDSIQPLGFINTPLRLELLDQQGKRKIFVQQKGKPTKLAPIVDESVIRHIKGEESYRPPQLFKLEQFIVRGIDDKLTQYKQAQLQAWTQETSTITAAFRVAGPTILHQKQQTHEADKTTQASAQPKKSSVVLK